MILTQRGWGGGRHFWCVCLCAADLGLGHDIEVVVVRREGHVSEDGSVLHRLHGLVLQSERGAVDPDLGKNTQAHIRNSHTWYMIDISNYCGAHVVSQVCQQSNIKRQHSTLDMKYCKIDLKAGLLNRCRLQSFNYFKSIINPRVLILTLPKQCPKPAHRLNTGKWRGGENTWGEKGAKWERIMLPSATEVASRTMYCVIRNPSFIKQVLQHIIAEKNCPSTIHRLRTIPCITAFCAVPEKVHLSLSLSQLQPFKSDYGN